MSGTASPAQPVVTAHERAEARTHIEYLQTQREHPLRQLQQLQRDLPQSKELEQIAAYIDFSSSRLESLIPIVSTQIYTSAGSVVLELIQNADDAKYDQAQRTSCTPYITITLFPDKVILEYNEDGFTRDDIERICDISNSNKGGDHTGEKGIGFKSVFMIASKVYIESKGYSFSFKHKTGDDPLQMFTPEYETPTDSPNGYTRITLILLEDQRVRSDAIQKFKEVPTTLLIFQRHIQMLSIIERHEDGTQSSTCTSYKESGGEGALWKNDGLESEKKFLIFRDFFDKIEPAEKRKNTKAEVKLAFPLTPNNTPLIERQQDVFARLPIGSSGVGLHFLVHSDFATSANRETVDEKSKRNADLLDSIAELFKVAVNTFCNLNSPYPQLRQQWMEFLPDNSVSSSFWKSLRVKIESNLATTPFLYSSSGRYDLIRNLRYVPHIFRGSLDEGRKPLFDDLPHNEKYLHSDFESQLQRLRLLGLEDLAIGDMIDRVKTDVESEICSSMRTTTDNVWHTHVALFLLSCKEKHPKEWEKILSFSLVPLSPASLHSWRSAWKADIYYPTVDEISVPSDLKLSLVTTDAAMHPDRRRLFTALGVGEPPIDLIRKLILGRYDPGNSITLQQSLKHSIFMWWTYPKGYKRESTYKEVRVFNNVNLVSPLCSELFFDSDDSFGVQKLFPNDPSLILHQIYLATPLPTAKPGHLSWKDWLRDSVGVQDYPRLADRGNPAQLSPIFERISKESPDKVVGVLHAHWHKHKDQISKPIRDKVSCIKVPRKRRNGNPSMNMLKFADLPFPALIKACESFGVDERYPFLNLPPEVTDRDLTEWEFLTNFGVNKELNLDFYLMILRHFQLLEGEVVQERVFKLYLQIQCQCVQAESDQPARNTVQNNFAKHKLLWLPTSKAGSNSWILPAECLWDAPTCMKSKIPLRARYSSIFDATIPTDFFRETLLIRNTTAMDLFLELDFIRREGSDICHDSIKDIYMLLNTMRLANDSIGNVIRERFETGKLVWVQSDVNCWKSPSSCLWSSKAQLTDKPTISGQYGRGEHKKELKAFFTDCLKVTEPTLKMLAEELQLLSKSFAELVPAEKEVSVRRLKSVVEVINSLQLDESCTVRESLLTSSIFPVRWEGNRLSLESTERHFSIRDRENYWEAFKKEVPMLDLTLEEVNELGPFLRWMNLEGRYLSHRVIERSEFSGTTEECSNKLTRDLRFRASALLRCAFHFKSPKTQKNGSPLFQLLSKAKVYQTSGISTYLDLFNGKKRIATVPSSTSKIHIEQKSMTDLRIYVPSDEKQRFICYCKLLPERLISEVFMNQATSSHSKTDSNSARVLAAVLNAPQDKLILEDLLTEFGVRRLPDWVKDTDVINLSAGLAELEMASSSGESNGNDDERGSQTSVDTIPTSQSLSRTGTESASSISFYPESRSSSLSASRSASAVLRPNTQLPYAIAHHPQQVSRPPIPAEPASETRLERQDEFISLLGRLRDAARQKTIPIRGSSEMSPEANAIEDHSDPDSIHPTSTTAFGTRALNQLRHDMKIGAAGELFVYELLTHLPPFPSGRTLDFNESNWPSSIRDYVRVHPACAQEFPECSKRREQADIIFDDKHGDFTQYMIDKDYLDAARFQGAKPKYFIEVKSTLKECKTKFYMSKSQYDRMHQMAANTDNVVKNVYMIFRVFYLGTPDIGLRVYADPGELKFIEESFAAIPKASSI